MAGYVQDNAASVRGVALRVAALGPDGAGVAGSPCDVYLTGGFITASFTPAYSTGDEIEQKNAAGEVCVYFKMPDTLKNVGLNLAICDPDPVLTNLLVGGDVLTVAFGDPLAPTAATAGSSSAIGYAAESIGVEANPYGVSIEIWAQAVVGGKASNVAPYWHYVFPYAKFRLDGDRVLENGALATVFVGEGNGNAAFGPGPNMDTSAVAPAPSATAWDWVFPTYADRPYMYSRSIDAPVGLKGCFVNQGVPVTAITAGIPATYTPSNATRPYNLTALTTGGAKGNTTLWTSGQYVVLGDGSESYWDSNSWEFGRAPASVITATGATAGTPGYYTPTGAANPATFAAMTGKVATPSTNWLSGQYVNVGDGTFANWSGSAWVAGKHA